MVKLCYVDGTLELDGLRRNAPLSLIAARIRRARKDAGLSHDQLGEAMGGVYRQNLIGYEKGKHRPGLEMLQRLAEATGRDPRWFVDPELAMSPFRSEGEAA